MNSQVDVAADPGPLRRVLPIFAATVLSFVVLAPGYVNNVDGWVVYHANRSLFDSGSLSMVPTPDQAYAQQAPYVREAEGRRYHVFGHVFAWLTLPFYVAGRALSGVVALDGKALSAFTFSLSNTVVTGLAIALWALAAGRLGSRRRETALFVLLLAVATPTAFYAGSGWREPMITLGFALVALAFLRFRQEPSRGAVGLGLTLGLLFLMKEGNAILVAPVFFGAMAVAWRSEGRAPVATTFRIGLPILVAIVFHATVMGVRFGQPFSTHYEPGLSFIEGNPLLRLAKMMVSAEMGLLVYGPLVLLGVASFGTILRRDRAFGWTLVGAAIPFVVLHTLIRAGEGGRDVWGPRHLVPLFPPFVLAVVLSLRWRHRAWRGVVGLVAAWSLVMQLVPAIEPYHLYPDLLRAADADPEAPPGLAAQLPSRPVGSFLVAGRLIRGGDPVFTARDFGVDSDWTFDRSDDAELAGGLNVWWLRRDAPRGALILGLLLLVGAVWFWRRVFIAAAADPEPEA